MPNAWVTHVKKFAANNNVSYSCAISMPECKQSYKKEPTKVSTIKEKEEPKLETKPYTKYDKPIGPVKPKETKPYTKYDKPIGPVKPVNIENIKKNEEIINDIETTLISKSTRNIRAFQKKYSNSELLKNLFEGQAYNDFFPTSQKCLEHFNDYLRYIEKEENILEPSAGIGSIVHYLQKKGYKNIEANDFDKTMTDYIKKNYNNVKVTNEDFIKKNYDNNDFSLIFCNPPFTFGTNKTFYIDFLFKCFDILTKSKIKYEKNIFFICPQLTKNDKEGDIIYKSNLLNTLSKVKKNSLFKQYNLNDDEDYEDFFPNQILNIGSCQDFPGTKFKASLYHIIKF
jgi:16S rRNA G966 N2-methylase RsmD